MFAPMVFTIVYSFLKNCVTMPNRENNVSRAGNSYIAFSKLAIIKGNFGFSVEQGYTINSNLVFSILDRFKT